MSRRPRVLYISSSSIIHPLVISQVIRYLKGLGGAMDVCHLLSFEREPLTDRQATQVTSDLAAVNIHWQPLAARSGNRVFNAWREIQGGYRLAVKLVRQHDLNIIHARSFIPGNVGLRVAKKTGAKLLYDMRGFWAEEKWAKGTIQRPTIRRCAQHLENRLLHGADALVSLTNAGKQRLLENGIRTPVDVIPCCADTDIFRWDGRRRNHIRKLISVGSLGPGYLPEAVFGIFAAAQTQWPGVQLQLLTQTDRGIIDRAARAAGCDLSKIEVTLADPSDVPKYLRDADLGLCMIQPSKAKIASSPTKLAEYLACGLSVIANCDEIGDLRQIVLGNRVGANLTSFDINGYRRAVLDAHELLIDEDLSTRCRTLAEQEFAVTVGVQTYKSIYDRLIADSH